MKFFIEALIEDKREKPLILKRWIGWSELQELIIDALSKKATIIIIKPHYGNEILH